MVLKSNGWIVRMEGFLIILTGKGRIEIHKIQDMTDLFAA